MKRIFLSILTLFILFGCNFTTQEPKTIDAHIQKALHENTIPSLSIGVIQNGEIALLKGFGTASRADSTRVNENSIFQIASQSKMFTGIIVNNLIEEGRLDIEEPIITYFPKNISDDCKTRLAQIKLKYLLNHTSGIPSDACSIYSQRAEGEAWTKGYSKESLIADINHIELAFEPNSQFQYSNSGYAIAGFICENVSGNDYAELLRKYVSGKYGLSNTEVRLTGQQKALLVMPYRKDEREVPTAPSAMGMATPASAIYSTAMDLTKILSEQLIAYRNNEKQHPLILTEHTSKMDEDLQYGFGLIQEIKADKARYGHGGDADGFACEYFFNPTKNNGVVILTSSGGRWVGKLATEILEDLD